MKLPPMRRRQVHLAVHRYDDSVYYRRIERETLQLLSALRDGASVVEAAAQAFEASKLTASRKADCLRESFSLASELGWLCPFTIEDLFSSEPVM